MSTTTAPDRDLIRQVASRRTFAIISHPDAGKTTLTEKFLLYAGAVGEAGVVKSRKHARTLCAADAAVMVLDAAKGLEPQTLKLFRVCRERGLPVVTFVNKCDRPALPPLALLDQVAAQIGLDPVPLTWPVADGAAFAGVVDRRTGELIRFARTAHGATVGSEARTPFATADPGDCPPDQWQAAAEELELLDLDGRELDQTAFQAGTQTPVFFGSALANFGVRALLEGFAELAPPPGPQRIAGTDGQHRPLDAPFSAMVFKVQANMDPRHRDRIAFLRVQSGRFTRGMTATLARTSRPFQLKYAHQLFAQDRRSVEEAVPGDIVGVVNATGLKIGDTLYQQSPVAFPPVPAFAPECFATVRNLDSSRYKRFKAGTGQLDEEGVVHLLRRPDLGDQEPILAGVGQLQFEVFSYRMQTEFGCPVEVRPAPWRLARQINPTAASRLQGRRGTMLVTDTAGRTLVLLESESSLRWIHEDFPDLQLTELGTAQQSP